MNRLDAKPARRALTPKTVLLFGLAFAALYLSLGAFSVARAECAGQWETPGQLKVAEGKYAIWCLVNEQRAAAGVGPLAPVHKLGMAAQRHSRAMDARNFFGHTGDGSPLSRAKRSGYVPHHGSWGLGEALFWGQKSAGTPAAAVDAMMKSPTHRETLLSASFHDIGVGVVRGSPAGRSRGHSTIYTVDLGYRG